MKKLFIFFEEFLLAGSVLGDETGPQLFPIINSIEVITAVVSLTEHRGYNIEVEPTESFASQATAFFKGLANIFRSKGFFVSVHLYIDFKFEVITPTTDAFTLFIVALPIWLLYELSIFIVKSSD